MAGNGRHRDARRRTACRTDHFDETVFFEHAQGVLQVVVLQHAPQILHAALSIHKDQYPAHPGAQTAGAGLDLFMPFAGLGKYHTHASSFMQAGSPGYCPSFR
jgi:hypothetical protein